MPEPHLSMPAGRHYAVTVGIPDSFGGMTNALLKRSGAITRVTGEPVDILTFGQRNNYPEVRARLTRRGLLMPGVRLVNMWDQLADLSDRRLHGPTRWTSAANRLTQMTTHGRAEDAPPCRKVTKGNVTDFLRADGSTVAQVRRAEQRGNREPERTFTLIDRSGNVAQEWGQLAQLHHWWLDSILSPSERHWLIIDARPMAVSLASYRRKNVHRFHLVHNLHLRTRDSPPFGHLSSLRSYLGPHVDSFDGTVFLTEQQRRDVEILLGSGTNRHAIANSCEPPASVDMDRPRRAGVMLAGLYGRKRIDHAMRAVAALTRRDPDSAPRVTVYGQGAEQATLDDLRHELGLDDQFVLAGYRADAVESFRAASFSLLTSTYEGLPLVLAESMGAGCIPIAYDISYGPAQVINHGRDGFLVPAGDIDALAEQIREFVNLPEPRVLEMRHAARRRAADFSERAIVGQWTEAFRTVPRPKPTSSSWRATIAGVEVDSGDAETQISAAVQVSGLSRLQRRTEPRFSIVYRNDNCVFVRSRIERPVRTARFTWTMTARVPADNARWIRGEIVDVNVEVVVGTESRLHKLPAPPALPSREDLPDSYSGVYRSRNGKLRLMAAREAVRRPRQDRA